jgi:hypothetical protein
VLKIQLKTSTETVLEKDHMVGKGTENWKFKLKGLSLRRRVGKEFVGVISRQWRDGKCS